MIGIISRTYWPGTICGASRHLYIIKKLLKKQFKFKVYTWDKVTEPGVKQVSIPKIKGLGSLLFSLKTAKLINKDPKIKFVQVNQFWSEYTPLFLKKPFSALIHDVPDNNNPLLSWNVKKAAEKAKVIFYVSKLTGDKLKAMGIPSKKLVYAPPGIDEALRNNKKYSKNKYVKKGELMFLHVSRIAPNKDLVTIIEALNQLKDKVKFKLLVVGQKMEWSDYYKKVENKIKEYKLEKNVKLLGKVSDEEKIKLFKCADLYLHASYFGEGFGIPIVEAQAAGVPAIASDLFKETGVIKDGQNGLIFKRRNPEELSNKIIKVLSDSKLRQRLVKGGKKYSSQFSWKESANKMAKYYKKYDL